MALVKLIVSYLGASYFQIVFLTIVYNYVVYKQKHALTSLERAHSIT